jgi:hypothetical protein
MNDESFPRCIAEISTSAVIGLNKTSEYDEDFNPMDVLEGVLT